MTNQSEPKPDEKDQTEPLGTFACPRCGQDTPHNHDGFAPNERDRQIARIWHRDKYIAPESLADLIAAYRVEIEAQAKRDGAREALEKAAQIFDETAKQKQKLVWIPEAIAQQIRSLIEPTPVEPEVKSEVTLKLSDFTGESKQKMVEEIRASEKISGRDLQPEAAHRKAR